MPIALVTDQHALTNLGSPGASVAAAFPSGTRGGNLICVLAMCSNAVTATAPTDDKGNTYLVGAPETTSAVGGQRVSHWYAKNCAPETRVVTAHFSASSNFSAVAIAEYEGADQLAPLDKTGGLETTSTADALSPAVVPSVNGELIWGGCVNNTGASNVAGTPYTLLDTNAASGAAHEYQIQGVAASITTEFKGALGAWAVLVATFKPAPAPPVIAPQSGQASSGVVFRLGGRGGALAFADPALQDHWLTLLRRVRVWLEARIHA